MRSAILEARVRAIYIEEEPDALSVLVSATTFGDLIDGYEFVNRIGLQDQRIVGQVETAKRRRRRSVARPSARSA